MYKRQRQCWNLDSFIPTLLYPRFVWLRDNAHGYDASFPDENAYNKGVMNPIIDALELHLVFYTIGYGDAMIEEYRKKKMCIRDSIYVLRRGSPRV